MLRFVFTFGLGLCIAGCNGGFKPNDDSNTDDVPCEDGVDCPEDCGDGTDNDGDGNTDCSDSDCSDSESCVEDCYDGIDNDGDTFVDCDDADCAGQCTEDCTDNIDNDGDGAVDCDDTDCAGAPACEDIDDDSREKGSGGCSISPAQPEGLIALLLVGLIGVARRQE